MEENSFRGGGEAHREHGAEGRRLGTQGGRKPCFPEAPAYLRLLGSKMV